MSRRQTFVMRALAGEVLDLAEIDEDIGLWHRADTRLELHEWLGMSRREYALFVERPESLRVILAAHKSGKSVEELLESINRDGVSLAARGASKADAAAIRQWLRKTGRL